MIKRIYSPNLPEDLNPSAIRYRVGDCDCVRVEPDQYNLYLYNYDSECNICAGSGVTAMPFWELEARYCGPDD